MLLHRRLAVSCTLATIAVAAGNAQDAQQRVIPFDTPGPVLEIPGDALPPGELDVLRVRSSDPAMNRAFALARASLPAALSATEKRRGWFSPSLALYVAFKVADPEKRVEFVWVDNIRRRGKGYSGTLAGHPRFMPDKRIRSSVTFLNPQIADWAVQAEDGRYYGYFTTRARLPKIEAPLADDLRALLVENPVPALWR